MKEEKILRRNIALGFFILILIALIPAISVFKVSSSTLSTKGDMIPSFLNRTTSINITVVIDSTFDQTIDFEDLLAAYETKYSSRSSLNYTGIYNLNLEYRYLTNQEHNDFITYLQSTQNVGGPNGYEINTSVTFPEEDDEFIIEKEGVAFNATDTILWLADNFWNQKKNEYSLFLFNLTGMDAESGLPHWWLNKPVDIDTNSVPLELLELAGCSVSTLTYGSQVPAWGGWRYPIHFIDLSAEYWMGEFLKARNESPLSWNDPSSSYNHLLTNLSDFGNPVNVSDVLFLPWLESWVNDFILGIYRESVMGKRMNDYYFQISENISVQTLVINNWSEHQDNDEVSWLIHDDRIDAEFSRAFPWIDFEVTTTWKDLSDFPSLEEEIAKYISFDTFDGKGEIELFTGFSDYCRQTLFPSVFDYTAADRVLPSLILLFDNITSVGFSFGEDQIMGLDSTLFFRQDGVTPDAGLSSWILHEVGHSIGVSHPFDGFTKKTWGDYPEMGMGSMFTSSIMTYNHQVPEFSIYDTNAIGHATSDYYLAPAEWYASELKEFSGIKSSTSFEDVLTLLHQAQDAQKNWNYSGAIFLAKEALASLADLYESATPTTTPSWTALLLLLSLFVLLPWRQRKKKS